MKIGLIITKGIGKPAGYGKTKLQGNRDRTEKKARKVVYVSAECDKRDAKRQTNVPGLSGCVEQMCVCVCVCSLL